MSIWFKLGGIAVAAFAVWLGLTLFGNARFHAGELTEAVKWQAKVTQGEKDKLAEYQRGVEQGRKAETVYRSTEQIIQPVQTRIIERAAQYANTPSGAAECLDADRVRALDQTRSALFPAAYPGGASSGTGTVPANAAGSGS